MSRFFCCCCSPVSAGCCCWCYAKRQRWDCCLLFISASSLVCSLLCLTANSLTSSTATRRWFATLSRSGTRERQSLTDRRDFTNQGFVPPSIVLSTVLS